MSRSSSRKPVIGITVGDPAGIGPEVVSKVLKKRTIQSMARFVVIGHAEAVSLPKSNANIELYSPEGTFPKLKLGRPSAKTGLMALSYLKEAKGLLRKGVIQGLVTAPVSKEWINQHDSSFVGHTEFLAKGFKAKQVGMMFVGPSFKTIVTTRHLPLKKVSKEVTLNRVFDTIQLSHQALRQQFGIRQPRLGICGLNPHAGEGGQFGREEIDVIIPAIKKAKKSRINAQGPFAADTLFTPENIRHFDLVIAMYHDQGLIPIKTVDFHDLVNLTVGLPFVRTSPAHGTAFDIAGKGKADSRSMEAAIRLAIKLSIRKANN